MRKSFLLVAICIAMAINAGAQNESIIEGGGSGPYKAVMTSDVSLTTHTIFRPKDISKFSKGNLLPILLWGNGGCAKSCSGHVNFLNDVASQGFFIVAIGPMPAPREAARPGQTGGGMPQIGGGTPVGGGIPQMGGGAPAGGRMPQMGGGMPQMGGGSPTGGGMSMGDPADLKIALEWVIAQNVNSNSPYYGKLDIENIAAAGMSCGGLEAIRMSDDSRVKTILVMNSGLFNDGADKGILAKMKQKSVIWILGGPNDMAYENGMDDFKRMSGSMPAFICSLYGIGHGGTYMQPFGGDYSKVAGAWLKWWLKNDKEAGMMFTGDECGLSKLENWTVDRKNIK